VKQKLAAVRVPKHVVKTGKTPVLEGSEWRKLLESIPTETVRDLRDRALIATLTYSFARISAALKMKVEDLRPQGAGWRVLLHEKGGKEHAMPCHHALAEALRAYIDAAGIVPRIAPKVTNPIWAATSLTQGARSGGETSSITPHASTGDSCSLDLRTLGRSLNI